MRRFLLLIGIGVSLLSFASIAAPMTASAVDVISDVCNQPTGSGDRPAVCNTNENASNNSDNLSDNPIFGPRGVITKAVQILAVVLGIVVVFVILINSVRLITSNGDANTVTSARNGIIYAAVGAVIAISAQLIVTLILSRINT